MRPKTRQEYDDLAQNLAEGFHTAFRKASSHPNAHQIWTLIRDLPAGEWTRVVDFVMWGVFGERPKKDDSKASHFRRGDKVTYSPVDAVRSPNRPEFDAIVLGSSSRGRVAIEYRKTGRVVRSHVVAKKLRRRR